MMTIRQLMMAIRQLFFLHENRGYFFRSFAANSKVILSTPCQLGPRSQRVSKDFIRCSTPGFVLIHLSPSAAATSFLPPSSNWKSSSERSVHIRGEIHRHVVDR